MKEEISRVLETEAFFIVYVRKHHYTTKEMIMEASSKGYKTIITDKGNSYVFNVNIGNYKNKKHKVDS